MMVVVDAGVAAKWFVEQPESDAARRVLDSDFDLVAPDLIITELFSVFWNLERARAVSAIQAAAALRELPRIFASLVPSLEIAGTALEIARRLDHPVYDALYVSAAERVDAPLITDDRRLAHRVSGTPWARRVLTLSQWATEKSR
jgi:predicted nucleic acid-binding protein